VVIHLPNRSSIFFSNEDRLIGYVPISMPLSSTHGIPPNAEFSSYLALRALDFGFKGKVTGIHDHYTSALTFTHFRACCSMACSYAKHLFHLFWQLAMPYEIPTVSPVAAEQLGTLDSKCFYKFLLNIDFP